MINLIRSLFGGKKERVGIMIEDPIEQKINNLKDLIMAEDNYD